MASENDEIIVDDGSIPIVCPECGADFVWRVEFEDVPTCCPACRAEAAKKVARKRKAKKPR